MDYKARYYDPRLGRFVSADTVVPEPGNPQALNRYSYVLNNPLKFTDSMGHRHECGTYAGECSSDTYYAGVSVLDERPEVQAYLKEAMAPKHYLEPIAMWAVGGMLGGVVGDVVGDLIPGFRSPPVRALAGERLPHTETPGNAVARQPVEEISEAKAVDTPYGPATQDTSPSARTLRQEVATGRRIYRGGAFGKSDAAEGQFWAVDNPLELGYADKYGVASFSEPDFVLGGTLKPGTEFVSRPAPGVGTNLGGALEIVVEPGNVQIDFFYMP